MDGHATSRGRAHFSPRGNIGRFAVDREPRQRIPASAAFLPQRGLPRCGATTQERGSNYAKSQWARALLMAHGARPDCRSPIKENQRVRCQNSGLLCLVLATAACEKSAREERDEAISAQREADKTALEAQGERNEKVTEANREASREVAEANKEANRETVEAQREARKETLDAVEDEIEKTSGAQREANEEAREAVQAGKESRGDVAKSVAKRLADIEEKHRELNKEAMESTSPVPADVRQNLDNVAREAASLRSELKTMESDTSGSLEQFRVRADQKLTELDRTLERVDDKI
jgi:chemotaxis protein histidine kinase CheA